MSAKSKAIESYLVTEASMEAALEQVEETMRRIAGISEQRREMFMNLMRVLDRECAGLISSSTGEDEFLSGSSRGLSQSLDSNLRSPSGRSPAQDAGGSFGPRTGNTSSFLPAQNASPHDSYSVPKSTPQQQGNPQSSSAPVGQAAGQRATTWCTTTQLICPHCLVPLRVTLEKEEAAGSSPQEHSCRRGQQNPPENPNAWHRKTYNSIEDNSPIPPPAPLGQKYIPTPPPRNFQRTPADQSIPCSSSGYSDGSTIRQYRYTIPAPQRSPREFPQSSYYSSVPPGCPPPGSTSGNSSFYTVEEYNNLQQQQDSRNNTFDPCASSSDRSTVLQYQYTVPPQVAPIRSSPPCSSRMTSSARGGGGSSTLYGAGTNLMRSSNDYDCDGYSRQSSRSGPTNTSNGCRDTSFLTSADIYLPGTSSSHSTQTKSR